MAQERAEGFVEVVEAARTLTPATIEGLFSAVEEAVARRQRGAGAMNGEAIQENMLSALVSQHVIRETVMGRVAGYSSK